MKRILTFFLVVCLMGCGSDIQTQKSLYRVTVPGVWNDCPVVIGEIPVWAQSAVVRDKGVEVPSQLDRKLNELVFVTGIVGSKEFEITFSSEPPRHAYPYRVHAQMPHADADPASVPADTLVFSGSGRLNGPVFESELAAFRILFDGRPIVDACGKKHMRLELAGTNGAPTRERIEQRLGCCNLAVGGSIGLGALNGWDAAAERIVPIRDCKGMEVLILAKGPVRTVVETHIAGWRYGGRTIDLTARYLLYAGHGDMRVENTIAGDFRDLVFTAGIVRADADETIIDREVIASLGRSFPSSDRRNPGGGERIGLVIAVPSEQVVSQIDDRANYLFQLKPDARGRIDYMVEMLWRESDWLQNRSDDECMLSMLDAGRLARRKVIVSRIR